MIEWSEKDYETRKITTGNISESIAVKGIDDLKAATVVYTRVEAVFETYVTDKLRGDKTLILEAAKLQIEELEEELREAKEKIDKYIKEHRDM